MTKSNKTGFKGAKLKVAEMLTNPDYTGSISEICQSAGVSRNTFYRWMKEPEYLAYIQEQIDSFTDYELSAVWKSLIAKCKNGDVQAIKLYFELKGKYSLKVEVSEKLSDVFKQIGGEGLAE